MRADELLTNVFKYDLPFQDQYDRSYANESWDNLLTVSKGNPAALYEIGLRYLSGAKGAEEDTRKAYSYFEKVLYYQKHTHAMYSLGLIGMLMELGTEEYEDSFAYLKTAYSLGDHNSASLLGRIYAQHPRIVPRNVDMAIKCLEYSREGGCYQAEVLLGDLYREKDMYANAYACYKNAFERGDNAAAEGLGYLYYFGMAVPADLEEAKKYLRISYQHDKNTLSLGLLGTILLKQAKTADEEYEAYRHLKVASDRDCTLVNLKLGLMLYKGIPGKLVKDYDAAIRCLLNTSECDRPTAYYLAACCYREDRQEKEYRKYIQLSAQLGCPNAQNVILLDYQWLLAYCLNSNLPLVTEYDDKYDKASVSEVLKASETDPAAMFEMGSRFRMGVDGVKKNQEKAISYYRRVLLYQRNRQAMYHLGFLIQSLSDEASKQRESLEFWKAGYSLGDSTCARQIGIAYTFGIPDALEQNFHKALHYLNYAKAHGEEECEYYFGALYAEKGELDKSLSFYLAGAKKGDADCQFFAGKILCFEKNEIAEGMKWLRKAAEQGNEDAKVALEKIQSILNKQSADENRLSDILSQIDALKKKGLKKFEDFEKIINLLSEALEIDKDRTEVIVQYILFWNHFYLPHQYDDVMKSRYESVLEGITFLEKRNYDPKFCHAERSLASVRVAQILRDKGEIAKALKLLQDADRNLHPYASVLRILCDMYYFDEGIDKNETMIREEGRFLRNHFESLKWETPLDEGKACSCMALLFGPNSAYNRTGKDVAFARKCAQRCVKLNPAWAEGEFIRTLL